MRSVTVSVPSCQPKRLWAQLCNAQLRNLGARGAVREHRGGARATSRAHAAEERVLEQTATASVVVNRSVRERMLYGRGTRTGPGRGPAARMAAVLCAVMACSMMLPLVEPGTTLGESSTTEAGATEALTKSSTTLGESFATEASAIEALTKSSTMLGESSATEAGAAVALIGCWVLRDGGDGARELRSHAAAAAPGGGDGEAAPPARHDAGRALFDGGERHDGADPSLPQQPQVVRRRSPPQQPQVVRARVPYDEGLRYGRAVWWCSREHDTCDRDPSGSAIVVLWP